MEEILKGMAAQLGAIALLIGYMFWTIKTKNEQCAEERRDFEEAIKLERDRNQQLTDRVITLGQDVARTMTELRAAIEAMHP